MLMRLDVDGSEQKEASRHSIGNEASVRSKNGRLIAGIVVVLALVGAVPLFRAAYRSVSAGDGTNTSAVNTEEKDSAVNMIEEKDAHRTVHAVAFYSDRCIREAMGTKTTVTEPPEVEIRVHNASLHRLRSVVVVLNCRQGDGELLPAGRYELTPDLDPGSESRTCVHNRCAAFKFPGPAIEFSVRETREATFAPN